VPYRPVPNLVPNLEIVLAPVAVRPLFITSTRDDPVVVFALQEESGGQRTFKADLKRRCMPDSHWIELEVELKPFFECPALRLAPRPE
jgi:hypothetical protein